MCSIHPCIPLECFRVQDSWPWANDESVHLWLDNIVRFFGQGRQGRNLCERKIRQEMYELIVACADKRGRDLLCDIIVKWLLAHGQPERKMTKSEKRKAREEAEDNYEEDYSDEPGGGSSSNHT